MTCPKVKYSDQIARLESTVDFLETELNYLNNLLLKSGFPEGIQTLKSAVEELLAEDSSESD